MQTLAAVVEYNPEVQAEHDVAPVPTWIVPAPQPMQPAEPVPEYMPAEQLWHTFEADPADARYIPGMQFVHAEAPTLLEYDPAAQLEHDEEPL